jgi:hypothetical protein
MLEGERGAFRLSAMRTTAGRVLAAMPMSLTARKHHSRQVQRKTPFLLHHLPASFPKLCNPWPDHAAFAPEGDGSLTSTAWEILSIRALMR